jgi:hypothetical protein
MGNSILKGIGIVGLGAASVGGVAQASPQSPALVLSADPAGLRNFSDYLALAKEDKPKLESERKPIVGGDDPPAGTEDVEMFLIKENLSPNKKPEKPLGLGVGIKAAYAHMMGNTGQALNLGASLYGVFLNGDLQGRVYGGTILPNGQRNLSFNDMQNEPFAVEGLPTGAVTRFFRDRENLTYTADIGLSAGYNVLSDDSDGFRLVVGGALGAFTRNATDISGESYELGRTVAGQRLTDRSHEELSAIKRDCSNTCSFSPYAMLESRLYAMEDIPLAEGLHIYAAIGVAADNLFDRPVQDSMFMLSAGVGADIDASGLISKLLD